jgi:hypothetical protein
MPVDLGNFIKVQPPIGIEQQDGILNFERERDIPVDWEDIIAKSSGNDRHDINYIRKFFQRNVNYGPENVDQNFTLEAGLSEGWFIPLGEPIGNPAKNWYSSSPNPTSLAKKVVSGSDRSADRGQLSSVEKLTKTSVGIGITTITHAGQIRNFVLLDSAGNRIRYQWFIDEINSDWDKLWGRAEAFEWVGIITSAETLTEEDSKRIKESISFTEMVRADGALIINKYQALKEEEKLIVAFKARANGLADLIADPQKIADENVSDLVERYNEFKSKAVNIENEIRKLSEVAKNLGYFLCATDEDTKKKHVRKDGNGKTVTLKLGKLYTVNPKTVTWTVKHSKRGKQQGFYGARKKIKWVTQHSKTYDHYGEVSIDPDPWQEILEDYEENGLEVYLFDQQADGSLTSEGIKFEEIVDRLIEDEEFRLHCIIAVPMFEASALGEELLSGYLIIGRPMPNLIGYNFPNIIAVDELSYQYAWTSTSLGELAATIPLGPGEEREVNLSTSNASEDRSSSSATSLIDIERTDTRDFSSEFEKEVRKDKSRSERTEGKVSGNYGGVEGSAKFSKNLTNKKMTRTLNKAVKKTSQKLNRKQRVETTQSKSESTSSNSSFSQKFTIANVNETATMNIMLYRVMNNYRASTKLENTRFYVETGRTLMEGLNIRARKSFTSNDIENIIDFCLQHEYFPLDDDEETPEFDANLRNQLSKALHTCSNDCFDHMIGEDGGSIKPLTKDTATRTKKIEEYTEKADATEADQRGALAEIEKRNSETVAGLKSLEGALLSGIESFSVDSGGLYSDVIMGVGIGTDQYSIDRRELEKKKVLSEIELNNARSKWLAFRASSTSRDR